ncbi:hypothetical protein [Paeniglutamicibacter cryotolerans]|uniref:Uncharacterized protein n=1 Tax=Paeniglutamicibacter cryotolerans TaxID=670079 RepID=A0A839QNT2_9MICC|nr:hypothetical protein [Paeniglutamicibacter cryotolerans]MBB2995656.1 hypothetical protein [Paeniglutamicibacter cryotolerans]
MRKTLSTHPRRPRILTLGLCCITLGLAGAHLAAAFEGTGAMAVVMGVMGVFCLTCLPSLRHAGHGVERSAFHLMFMSAAMAVIHLAWISLPGAGGHQHGSAQQPGAMTAPGATMLLLIALELTALFLASAVIRINRNALRRTSPSLTTNH